MPCGKAFCEVCDKETLHDEEGFCLECWQEHQEEEEAFFASEEKRLKEEASKRNLEIWKSSAFWKDFPEGTGPWAVSHDELGYPMLKYHVIG